MTGSEHWLNEVTAIFEAKTNDLRELARLAGGDPEIFYMGTSIEGADLRGQDLRGMKFGKFDISTVKIDVDTHLDEDVDIHLSREDILIGKINYVSSVGRQEERVVLICKLLLEYLDYQKVFLAEYKENKKFAIIAVGKLLSQDVGSLSESLRHAVLCRALDQVLNQAFPLARGYVLRYVAKHLGNIPEFRSFVEKRLVKNYTMSEHYDAIKMMLNDTQKL